MQLQPQPLVTFNGHLKKVQYVHTYRQANQKKNKFALKPWH